MRLFLLIWPVLLLSAPAPGQEPPAAKPAKSKPKRAPGEIDFRFNRRPVLRVGDWLRVEFRARAQGDFRVFSPDYETDAGLFDPRRLRFGVEGRAFRHFDYEIDAAVDDEFRNASWRDVYVNFRYFDDFQFQAGKFKLPFGREQTTSFTRIDFVFRARISDQLAPARDQGGMLHGRFFKRGLGYEIGFFRGDGENAYASDRRTGLRAWAGRVTATPLRPLPVPKLLRSAELGFALVSSDVPEGLGSIRVRSAARETLFPRIFAKGRRLRAGAEFDWTEGPFSLKGEFMHVSTQRRNQSILGTDLPDLIARGWYTSATWNVTGEKKINNRVEPRKPLFQGGFGALELGARYEQIRIASDTSAGTPQRNPRASHLVPQSDRLWTYGVNWFLNHWSRIQFNAIHETIEDPQRAIIQGRTRYWMYVTRLQFSM